MGVFVGWATAFALMFVVMVGFLGHEMATAPYDLTPSPTSLTPGNVITGLFALLLMLGFPLMMAFIVSGVISLIGWLLVGLPLAVFITDRMANNFWVVVPLHMGATIALSMVMTQRLPWRNIQDNGEMFLYAWGLTIVAIGSAAFCTFNRNVK